MNLELQIPGGGITAFLPAGSGWLWGGWGQAVFPPGGGVAFGLGVGKYFYTTQILTPITIRKVTVQIDSAIAGNVFIGIYSQDGNTKLIDSGAIANGGVAGVKQVILGTPVTLQPGIYQYVIMGDTPGLTVDGFSPAANTEQTLNQSTPRLGIPTNGLVGGALPATLGVLTANSTIGVMTALLEA